MIHQEAERYICQLFAAMTESGLDLKAMPAVFLGGGAALLKRHLPATDGPCRLFLLDDVCLNAKSFERLLGRMLGGGSHG